MKYYSKKVADFWQKNDLKTKIDFLRNVKLINLSKGYSITKKDRIDFFNHKQKLP
jgi:hypothetical protein